MFRNKNDEKREIQALLSITEEEVKRMDYKTKQRYYKDRSRICIARKSTQTFRKVK